MAKLLPDIDPRVIEPPSESEVAIGLMGLEDDCTILHSYQFLDMEAPAPEMRGGVLKAFKANLREAETDFIIIMPDFGILVVEVKGGLLAYDNTMDEWYDPRYPRIDGKRTSPFLQAHKAIHKINQQLLTRQFPHSREPEWGYGFAVIFPDCEIEGHLPQGAEARAIITARDMKRIPERIRATSGAAQRQSGTRRSLRLRRSKTKSLFQRPARIPRRAYEVQA
jgi:hypothetical protein